MKKFVYNNSLTLSITWAVVIFLLCATPGKLIPTATWLDLLSFDKLVHASMFFILCSLLLVVAIKRDQPKYIITIYFIACVAYGGFLEIMQAKCFSNRSGDWFDFIANSFGCIIAILLLKKMRKKFTLSS